MITIPTEETLKYDDHRLFHDDPAIVNAYVAELMKAGWRWCENCEEEFKVKPGRGRKAKYCSSECRKKSQSNNKERAFWQAYDQWCEQL